MRIRDLFEKADAKNGTYAGVRFSDKTNQAIIEFCKKYKVPNPVAAAKLHTTVLYSRKPLPNYTAAGKYDKPLIGEPTKWSVWDSQDKSKCLILEYKCSKLKERHKELMDEHEATYDFPEYKTHVTLSYDIGDFELDGLPMLDSDIEIVEEYSEDLNLDWAKEKGSKR